jgi:serine/threonine protein phosphatase 1
MPQRTIALGDIHGCSRALSAVLDAVQPGSDDTIVPIGDYIDRGIDSKGVIDLLLELDQHCRLVPIMGNHEQMLLEIIGGDLEPREVQYRFQRWLEFGGIATLDSYGDGLRLDLIPDAHIAFLARCRDYFETETHIFVHANYYPMLPMDQQPVSVLRWESLRDLIPEPHCSGKTAIVGHTSQKTGEVVDVGYLKCIDTFCYGGGWLTALDVNSGQVWQANERGELRK